MNTTARYVLGFAFPILGLAAGLAGSYVFSPTFMGIRAFTFAEWFSNYSDVPRAGVTIAVCAFVGTALGVFTSAIAVLGRPPHRKPTNHGIHGSGIATGQPSPGLGSPPRDA